MEWNEKGLLAESYSDIHSFITLEVEKNSLHLPYCRINQGNLNFDFKVPEFSLKFL